jgi:hypothetical protein
MASPAEAAHHVARPTHLFEGGIERRAVDRVVDDVEPTRSVISLSVSATGLARSMNLAPKPYPAHRRRLDDGNGLRANLSNIGYDTATAPLITQDQRPDLRIHSQMQDELAHLVTDPCCGTGSCQRRTLALQRPSPKHQTSRD